MRFAVITACCLVLGVGCVNLEPPPDPTRYFLMNGPDWADTEGGFAVKVESVRLEPYLTTHSMVVRSGENEILFSDVHRWAEPLDDNIKTVLNGYLAVSPIGTVSNRLRSSARLFVRVDVHRFEGHLPDRASLSASWTVEDASGQVLLRRRSVHTVSGWGGADYDQLAKLLETTVSMLADEIVSAL